MLAAMPRLTSSTPDLNRAISLVKASLDPVLQSPIVDGQLVQFETTVGAGVASLVTVSHGLGRIPQAYFVVRAINSTAAASDGFAAIFLTEVTAFPTTDQQLSFYVSTSPSVTGNIPMLVTLWVF